MSWSTLGNPVQEFATNGNACYMKGGEHGTRNTMFFEYLYELHEVSLARSSPEKSKDSL